MIDVVLDRTLIDFMSGAVFVTFTVCTIFFLRFWIRTKDIFFALLAAAFGFLALERLLAACMESVETRPIVYICRLIGFGLIIYAILLKNRAQKQ